VLTGVPLVRSIGGRGRVKHAEFAFASGEMTPPEYVEFLEDALGNATRVSRDDAVHFVCTDWRHMTEITEAGRRAEGGLAGREDSKKAGLPRLICLLSCLRGLRPAAPLPGGGKMAVNPAGLSLSS
jgi:hypothetical protein